MLELLIFFSVGLVVFTILSHFARKYSIFPEVIWMLLFGVLFASIVRIFFSEALSYDVFVPDPHIIIYIFVPLLIFSAARKFSFEVFQQVLSSTILLSLWATLISTAVIAGLAIVFLWFPLLPALLLGVMLSAVDPLAVSGLLKNTQDISESHKELIEGESILNDGIVMTLFWILSMLLFDTQDFSLQESIVSFFSHVLIALWIGVSMWYVIRRLLDLWHEDYYVTTMNLTLFLTFWSFFISEYLGWSWIISVFAAALTFWYHKSKIKHQKHVLGHIWKYLEESLDTILFFILWASFIFLFRWFDVSFVIFMISLVAIILWRLLSTWVLFPFLRIDEDKITLRDYIFLNLSAARGAISIVLVLLLPEDFVYREIIFMITCIAVMFSLIVYPQLMKIFLIKKN